MKFRVASDLHLDHSQDGYRLPVIDGEKDMAVILAGDLSSFWTKKKVNGQKILREFLEDLALRYKQVFFVPGNHDFCFTKYSKAYATLQSMNVADNVHVLMKKAYYGLEEEGIAIFGGTMWTDFNNEEPLDMIRARHCMIEYRYCPDLTPSMTVEQHRATIAEIEKFFADGKNLKRVVITHHTPSYSSMDIKYSSSPLNPAYHTELHDKILEWKPNLWVHGHTHTGLDYKIGDTRIVCNPRGYQNKHSLPEETGFIEDLVVEV